MWSLGKTGLNYDGDDVGGLRSHLKPIDNLPPVIWSTP